MNIEELKILLERYPIIGDKVVNSGKGWVLYKSGKRITHSFNRELEIGIRVTSISHTILEEVPEDGILIVIRHSKNDNHPLRIEIPSPKIEKLVRKMRIDSLEKE